MSILKQFTVTRAIIAALLVVGGYLLALNLGLLGSVDLSNAPEPVRNIAMALPGQEFNLSGNTAQAQIFQGCAFRDCIPSIDEPVFISAGEAEQNGEIVGSDTVFGVFHKGVARAYPLKILNRHEIVNETIEGDPILVTFCPLCGTAIGFERAIEVGGERKPVEFGVSGKLVNNNLVMYDRETNSLWQQVGGEAIAGDQLGNTLVPFQVDTVLWSDWKELHPDTEVLAQESGFVKTSRRINYEGNPYGNYDNEHQRFLFPQEATDDRLPNKAIVWGIVVNGEAKAYSDEALAREGTVKDTVGGENLTVTRNNAGQVRITSEAGEEIVPDRSMWFAWFAFNKDTELFR